MAYGDSSGVTVSRGGGSQLMRVPPRPVSVSVIRAYSPIVRPAIGTRVIVAHADGTLGEYEFDGLGFSLKGIVKSVGKVAGNIGKTVVKAAVDTGHVAGAVVTSKVGQAIIGGGLALTGVGLPAAIAIGAGAQAGGNLIKKGGNLGKAAKGAVVGGGEGLAAGLAGKVLKNNAGNLVDTARSKLGMGSFRPDAKTAVVGPVAGAVTKGKPLKFAKVPDLIHSPVPPGPPRMAIPPEAIVEPLLPAEVATETVKATAPVKLKDRSKGKNGGGLLDTLKRGAGKAKDALTAVEQTQLTPPQGYTGPVYNPGTGPMDAPPAATPDAPAQAGMLGGIPPVVLIGGGVLVLVMLTQKRGR